MKKYVLTSVFIVGASLVFGQNYISTTSTSPGNITITHPGSMNTGAINSNGNIINTSPTNGSIGLTGDLPGYTNGLYPTLKTTGTLYFSTGGKYSAYIGGGVDPMLGLND